MPPKQQPATTNIFSFKTKYICRDFLDKRAHTPITRVSIDLFGKENI